jgi:hypothetical protein
MAPAITVDVLPALRGDALWIECHRPHERPWRLLFDGGMPGTWPLLRERVLALGEGERVIDLAVVSHIDSDHIGGMLPLLAATDLGVTFGDIWFNGLTQLPEPGTGATRSVAEGESLVKLLSAAAKSAKPLPWNRAFAGRAAMTAGDGAAELVDHPGEPAITLLSPTPKRLLALRKKWAAELERLQRGEAAEPAAPPAPPAPLGDLAALAATPTNRDGSEANGSSIAFLLEHGGASCLLAADAFVPVLGAALTTLANERGGHPLELDVFKLSHHGSKGNVNEALLALAPARTYVVSTNGDRFHHPDDVALARVATGSPAGAAIAFNYETPATLRWAEDQLCSAHDYTATYPAAGGAGLRLEL